MTDTTDSETERAKAYAAHFLHWDTQIDRSRGVQSRTTIPEDRGTLLQEVEYIGSHPPVKEKIP
jgi:hypothetical protein